VEERRQVVLLAAGDDRRDDLVEVQVGEERGLRGLGEARGVLAGSEEDAREGLARQLPPPFDR
jgi:hypothetical protein